MGLRYPRDAIREWRRILESQQEIVVRLTESLAVGVRVPLHMSFIQSVIEAMLSLFFRAVELPYRLLPTYEQALEALAMWVECDAKERRSRHLGLVLFLALADIVVPSDDLTVSSDNWPPAMLYVVGAQPDSAYRRVLADLLRRALNNLDLRQPALQVLKQWAESAEHNPWLEETLVALLRDLLALPSVSERERGRLEVYLTRWANHPGVPLRVAGRLLTKLNLT